MMMRKEMTLAFIKIISHFSMIIVFAELFGDVIFLAVEILFMGSKCFSHFITHDYASN